MGRLEGKSIIVTGAASGIGRAAALGAARQGALLTLADLDAEGLDRTCAEARQLGAQAQGIPTDVSNSEQVQALVAGAVKAYGRLDGAFNNAGIQNANLSLTETPEDVYLRTHAVNSTSVFLCMKYEAIEMLKAGNGGAIVNTSSTAAVSTLPNMTDYGSAKASVLALTRAAALDLGRQGIRVNAIMPGPTHSKMFDEGVMRTEGLLEMLAERQPLGRIANASEVAAVALWLLSDEASIVTGASIPADGGLSIM